MRIAGALVASAAALLLGVPSIALAGAVFLTGHDPDFHAFLGGNTTGARNLNNRAIAFITDPGFNAFTATANKFLFVESKISAPAGHVNGVNGILASGYAAGTNFEHHDALTLNAELNLLGTKYNAIVVASDFGGVLTSAELNILNARSGDIIAFLNAGGGLYAMAESNSQAGLTAGSVLFGFLPFIVTSTQVNQSESGFTVTPFGASIGLVNSDINGNASHNVFNGAFGLNVVNIDAQGRIMSIAGRAQLTPGGVVPEPGTLSLLALALLAAGFVARGRRR